MVNGGKEKADPVEDQPVKVSKTKTNAKMSFKNVPTATAEGGTPKVVVEKAGVPDKSDRVIFTDRSYRLKPGKKVR